MNLKTKKEIKEEIIALGYVFISSYKKNKDIRIVIKDSSEYKYDVILGNLRKFTPCIVGYGNPFSDSNARKWFRKNNPDFSISKDSIVINSTNLIIFFHTKCKERFKSKWNSMTLENSGCPVCAGKQIGRRTSLAYLRPDLAKEWHPIKNGDLTPDNITCGSGNKVWWICSEEHEYIARIADRVKGTGCKKCSIKNNESKVANNLKKYFIENYNAKEEYKILRNPETNRWLPFDIYIPSGENPEINGHYIEIHSDQHYKLGNWHKRQAKRNNTTHQEEFYKQKHRDRIKKRFAKKYGQYIEIDLRKIKTVDEAIAYILNMIGR